jgi:hypothetical protein
MFNLGLSSRETGDETAAKKLIQDAHKIFSAVLGAAHPSTKAAARALKKAANS